VKKLRRSSLLYLDDKGNLKLSWMAHLAIGVGLGVAGWLLELAALVQ
jgi:hypothetical protein